MGKLQPFDLIDIVLNPNSPLLAGLEKTRDDALNVVVGKQNIDTCLPGDTSQWETGIKRNDEWTIVEQYESEEIARKKHKDWVSKIKKDPRCKLTDVNLYNL